MTKQIPLTQGKYALVDDNMYDELNQHKWCACKYSSTLFYAVRNAKVKGKRPLICMHREVLGLNKGDGKITDHVNRNGLDNRRGNLRIVSQSTNKRNHGGYCTNSSGYNGVSWSKNHKKWQAQIYLDNSNIHLGHYDTMPAAIKARKQGELKYWKEMTPDDPDHPVRPDVLPGT